MPLFMDPPRGVSTAMALDFDTVRSLRIIIAAVGFFVGAAAGFKYWDFTGALIGGVIGAFVGWNIPDFFKGRAQK
jgi:hypothetical protein